MAPRAGSHTRRRSERSARSPSAGIARVREGCAAGGTEPLVGIVRRRARRAGQRSSHGGPSVDGVPRPPEGAAGDADRIPLGPASSKVRRHGSDTWIGRDELASRANVTPERVDELTGLGLLEPDGDRHVVADVGRVAVIEALVEAGVPLDDLVKTAAAGVVSLAWFEGVLPPSPPSATRRIASRSSVSGCRPHSLPTCSSSGASRSRLSTSASGKTTSGCSAPWRPPTTRSAATTRGSSRRRATSATTRAGRPSRRWPSTVGGSWSRCWPRACRSRRSSSGSTRSPTTSCARVCRNSCCG